MFDFKPFTFYFNMAEKEDKLDISISTIITAMVSLVIIGYVAVPVVSDVIGSMTGDLAKYGNLMSITLVLMIVAVIVLVVRGYNSRGR